MGTALIGAAWGRYAGLLSRWDQLMQAVERPYAFAILKEKNRYITQAADSFERIRPRSDHRRADLP